MGKPTSTPDWTESNPSFSTVTIEPNAAKKQQGWFGGEAPPFQFMNWILWNLTQWVKYLSGAQRWGFVVADGAYGDYADLASAIAAASAGDTILVRKNLVLNSTVVINKANLRIEFDPGITISKGSATTGIQVTASGVRLLDGRMSGFSAPGDKAIEVLVGGTYSVIRDFRFASCDTDIDDQNFLATVQGKINE